MSHPFDATLKELLAPNPDDFVPVFGLPQLQSHTQAFRFTTSGWTIAITRIKKGLE
jgi:hypothetical protein